MDRLLTWIGQLPTTQSRVLVTLGSFLLTTVCYLAGVLWVLWTGGHEFWTPAYEWLAFLIVMSGLDLGSFMAKRTTDASYVAAKAGTAPTSKGPTPENAP